MVVKLVTTSSGNVGAPGVAVEEGAGVVVVVVVVAAVAGVLSSGVFDAVSVVEAAGVSAAAAAAVVGGVSVAATAAAVGGTVSFFATGFFGFETITTKKSFSLIPQDERESSSFNTFPE